MLAGARVSICWLLVDGRLAGQMGQVMLLVLLLLLVALRDQEERLIAGRHLHWGRRVGVCGRFELLLRALLDGPLIEAGTSAGLGRRQRRTMARTAEAR